MKLIKGKVFIKDSDVIIAPYEEGKDYYQLIKEYNEKGYEQIILTTDFMTAILKFYFIQKKYSISDIHPLDEDEIEVKKRFENYVEIIKEDRDYFANLIEDLSILAEGKNSIDIFKIELKGKNAAGQRNMLFVQINGVITMTNDSYAEEESQICAIIKSHIMVNSYNE